MCMLYCYLGVGLSFQLIMYIMQRKSHMTDKSNLIVDSRFIFPPANLITFLLVQVY